MKPSCPVARKEDYVVDHSAPHAELAKLIVASHYAHACSNTSTIRTGLYRRSLFELVGAALWMPPTANAAKGLAARHLGAATRHREVIVLSRLAVISGEPQNAASILLGASTRRVIDDGRFALLVTYADEAQGHTGTIYRATGWAFDGYTSTESRWFVDGKMVSRLACRSRTVDEMVAMGGTRDKSRKLRFVKLS